jgi:hypothetical protein
MRILFTIPHYYRPRGQTDDGRKHGSVTRTAQIRVCALTACLTALRELFGPSQCVLQHVLKTARLIEPSEPALVDVVVCTTGNDHLLGQLTVPADWWEERASSAPSLLLGYECHAVMRQRLGGYDYYCYLEDDLLLADPWLFRKLAWFGSRFGEGKLLQPNRFEAGPHAPVRKIYVDGDLPPQCTTAFQDIRVEPELAAEVVGSPVVFRRTSNPHAGCFFLSAAQMEHWARQPYFLDRAASFIGALESAATLGIMRTFQVYKPALENGDFLEIRHHGTAYLEMIRSAGH